MYHTKFFGILLIIFSTIFLQSINAHTVIKVSEVEENENIYPYNLKYNFMIYTGYSIGYLTERDNLSQHKDNLIYGAEMLLKPFLSMQVEKINLNDTDQNFQHVFEYQTFYFMYHLLQTDKYIAKIGLGKGACFYTKKDRDAELNSKIETSVAGTVAFQANFLYQYQRFYFGPAIIFIKGQNSDSGLIFDTQNFSFIFGMIL